MTTVSQIRGWLEEGKTLDARWVVILCDTFDWEDYPAFFKRRAANLVEATCRKPGGMNKVMEIYDLDLDIDTQLAERPAWHPPEGMSSRTWE